MPRLAHDDMQPLQHHTSPRTRDLDAASRPAELRGLARDEVKLLVTAPGCQARHATMRDLSELLRPGDLVVLNDSQTRRAALPVMQRARGDLAWLHASTRLDEETWVVELRGEDGHGTRPWFHGTSGQRIDLPAGAYATLLSPYSPSRDGVRLWRATITTPEQDMEAYFESFGHPIRYGYAGGAWPIEMYRTHHGRITGSAEMPSAGRGFTARLFEELEEAGVGVATLTLHTGVSSQEHDEPPYPEFFSIPEETRERVMRASGRVIAVGTTVIRALETWRRAGESEGWTDLYIRPSERVAPWIDGMISGFHPPDATHLEMLSALTSRNEIARAYEIAAKNHYLSHEFGDLHLMWRGSQC